MQRTKQQCHNKVEEKLKKKNNSKLVFKSHAVSRIMLQSYIPLLYFTLYARTTIFFAFFLFFLRTLYSSVKSKNLVVLEGKMKRIKNIVGAQK